MDTETSSVTVISENELDTDENKLTAEKVKLGDGTFNYIFTRISEDSRKMQWRCNICDVVVGGSLLKHSLGKKHQSCKLLPVHSALLWAKTPLKQKLDMKLAPGEPVPPGFEDEVKGVTEIQASLDSYHSGPLIGLEYLVELSVYEDEREPQYICLLCDKRGDPRTVMAHLVSFNHRMTYLMTHFPTAYRALIPYTKQYRRSVLNAVTTICEHIEKKFGRMIPQVADKETFEKKRHLYTDNVSKDGHPSERMGETFEYLINKEAIISGGKDALSTVKKNDDMFKGRHYRKSGSVPGRDDIDTKRDPSPPVVAAPEIRNKSAPKADRRSLSSISSVSSSSFSSAPSRSSRTRSVSRSRSKSRDNRLNRRRYPEIIRRSRSRSPTNRRRYYRRSHSRSPRPHRFRREPYVSAPYYPERLPWQRPDYGRSRLHYPDRRANTQQKLETVKFDRFEEYKKQCTTIEAEMEKTLEEHERNPEKHSMYPDEWKKFWNRRYKELQAENKDPTKHDFKPEWINFWNKRMKEMHDAEVKAKKDAVRKRLNLPEEPTPISFKIGNKKKVDAKNKDKDEGESSTIQDQSGSEPDVILIEDSKDDEPIERKRSHSPWEPELSREREKYERPDYSRDYYKKPYQPDRDYKRKFSPPAKFVPKEQDTEINIVAVLRLLTALEEKLGSLGPKIIDMLGQALALEKAEANSADTLLDNEVNCVLFETVKEKLKGQLLAGMVGMSSEKTFKNAIQKIASLLHYASERKKEKDKELQSKILEPVKIPGIGAIDKGAIAKQIATALIAQGKTDVTQAELEQLINAVVGMAQASQTTGKPVSTASFLQSQENLSGLLNASIQNTSKPESLTSSLQILNTNKSALESLSNLPSAGAMDSLSDSELKTLLQNFKDLSTDEQHSLITYLKKLEAKEPDRVERLRKFVKLGPSNSSDQEKAYTSSTSGRISPFSNRESDANPSVDELDKAEPVKSGAVVSAAKPEPLKIDSEEDEDYSYEDVFRAASKNVSEKQKAEESKKLAEKANDVNLTDAKTLIANLMGQLGKKNSSGFNLLSLGSNLGSTLNSTFGNISGGISGNSSGSTSVSKQVPQGPDGSQIGSKITTITTQNFDNNITYPDLATQAYPQNINNPVHTNPQMQSYQQPIPNQYNYPPQNRQFNANYDEGFQYQASASNYGQPPLEQPATDYNAYNADYGNMYGQSRSVAPPQYNRMGQQYPPHQPYDSRQNYY